MPSTTALDWTLRARWVGRLAYEHTCLGTEAAMAGFRVRHTLATKLVNELVEADDDMMLTRPSRDTAELTYSALTNSGYMALNKRGAELLFQVLTIRPAPPARRRRPVRPGLPRQR